MNLKKNILILLSCLLIGGFLSLLIGVDRQWDVMNYHIYNPYAFLNNRIAYDFMPADIQSYFNPLLDIPYFLMTRYLNNHPVFIQFIQGFYYGFLIFLIYKFSVLIFDKTKEYRTINIIASFLIGSTAAITLFEISYLANDIQSAIGILVSIYILLKYLFEKKSKYSFAMIFLSGLTAGMTVGLKLTAGLFVFGIILTFFFMFKKIPSFIKTLALFCLGVGIGFFITNGFWMYVVWSEFKNPFFPYFNNIFNSVWAAQNPILNSDFAHLQPQNAVQYIFLPFFFYYKLKSKLGCEQPFQDFRYAFAYISIIIIAVFSFIEKTKNILKNVDKELSLNRFYFLIILVATTYVMWIKAFAQLRYLIPIASLSGIIIIATLFCAKDLFNEKHRKSIYRTLIVLISSFLIMSTYSSYIYRVDLFKSNKVLDVQKAEIEDNAVVFALEGTSIVIPYQNPKAHYIYTRSPRFFKLDNRIISDKAIEKIRELTKKNKNRVYVLYFQYYDTEDIYALKNNLETYTQQKISTKNLMCNPQKKSKECQIIKTNFEFNYILRKVSIE